MTKTTINESNPCGIPAGIRFERADPPRIENPPWLVRYGRATYEVGFAFLRSDRSWYVCHGAHKNIREAKRFVRELLWDGPGGMAWLVKWSPEAPRHSTLGKSEARFFQLSAKDRARARAHVCPSPT